MSDQKQEAIKKLVHAGVKQDFATKVVEHSGHTPSEIINDPARVLEKYWYENVPVDFLKNAVAVNASELKRGLTALELQEPLVNRAYEKAPNPQLLAHRDIFGWGLVIVGDSLYNDRS